LYFYRKKNSVLNLQLSPNYFLKLKEEKQPNNKKHL